MCYCLPSQIEPSKVCEECGDDDAVVGLPLCSDCLWGTGAEA